MKNRWVSAPYIVWTIIFILVPLILVLYYSITTTEGGTTVISLENFRKFMQPVYMKVLLRSVLLALISTLICLLLGYPVAMILAGRDLTRKSTLILLFVIPMWMNFLLRTYAWMTLLDRKGVINSLLGTVGLPQINILYTDYAVVLGMVYNFLPFMVLPIFSVLVKIDNKLIEASEDLGADKITTFTKVIFPLSLPGVITGISMVFIPAVSTFVISSLLGGNKTNLIGNLIEQQFRYTGDWHFGSTMSFVLMIFILIVMAASSKFDKEKEGEGGGGLW